MWNLRCLCVLVALILPNVAFAHHGSSGQFETNKTIELSGEITRVRLVNPHAYVYFDVTNEDGSVTNMRCELQSGSLLKRRGWNTEQFKAGSAITILGSPDRNDPTTCYMQQITFENGVTANRNSVFDDNGSLVNGASTASAVDSDVTVERETIRADGRPNLAGNWAMVRKEGSRPGGGGAFAQLTDAGALAVEGATQDENPRYQCEPTNIIMDWWFDLMVNKIEQSSTQINLTYGFMSLTRTIYLDGTKMPEDYEPNRAGFSTGIWEGNTLVVTTTGFDEGWLMAPMGGGPGGKPDDASTGASMGSPQGNNRPPRPEGEPDGRNGPPAGPRGNGGPPSPAKNSREMVIVERFSLNEDGTVLKREYTITDPLYLKAPMTGSDEVTFTQDSYQPYDCDDLTAERGSGNLEPSATTLDNKTAGNDNLKDDNAARQSAMGTLYKLEDSKVGQTISNTEWGYPIVLSLHAIGMATMVGIALMLTLRVLGFASVIPVTAMANYWRVALVGFGINLVSGVALFCGNASELYFNWAFRIKILLVVAGLVLTWRLVIICIKQTDSVSTKHKKLAAVAMVSWVAAIIAGRLIGYMS
ncbi:hypothetical protein C7Y69_20330 [Alteromonas sp. KS69]|jgi:hypothetical protein|uniref:DUF6152 family protein n=1 Tax=Alteromonas sp. KS69 TaxID=2109917 RepID=UPI000C107175|nr:DUF6152 family protein [Alteromonas sp. KS69]PHS51968.1 MAG: hypothetical protein COB03_12875 [Alteromonas sp.]RUP75478.1 hypothetical protein C7Y69_20330 [Alteromonas sp. KS69]